MSRGAYGHAEYSSELRSDHAVVQVAPPQPVGRKSALAERIRALRKGRCLVILFIRTHQHTGHCTRSSPTTQDADCSSAVCNKKPLARIAFTSSAVPGQL